MKLFRTVSIMLALVAVPALAAADRGDTRMKQRDHRTEVTPAQRAAKKIARLDTNNDGSLSRREVKGTRLADRFAQIDTNRDGVLSKQELRVSIKAKQDARGDKKVNGNGKGKGKWQHKGKGKGKGKGKMQRHKPAKEA